MSCESLLIPQSISIILHHTRSGGNVGGAARAMSNMGLSSLILAEPAAWDRTRAKRVAAEAGEFLEKAVFVPTLEEALDSATLFIATSARPRKGIPSMTPEETAITLLEEAERGGKPALVFGDEKNGLPRWAIDRAYAVSKISTNPDTPSLNLAQSILAYTYTLRQEAIRRASLPPHQQCEEAITPEDLSRLRKSTRALLLQAGFLNPKQPDKILSELERLFTRNNPSDREAKLLLALVRQLEWAVGRASKGN